MSTEEFYDDDFIIKLTIDGTSYEEVEVKVTDTYKTIRDIISTIVSVFELSKMDGGGYQPITYLLGQTMEDGQDVILEYEDADGCELTLIDYNVQPGDHLHLIKCPTCGPAPIAKIKFNNMPSSVGEVLHKFMLDWNVKPTRCANLLWCGNCMRVVDLCKNDGSYVWKVQDLRVNEEIEYYICVSGGPGNNVTIVDKIKANMYYWKNRGYLKRLKNSTFFDYEWISPTFPRILNGGHVF